jgi:hypothetical protein
LSLQSDSPTPEPKFIGAFTRCYDLGKIGTQSSPDFFGPDRMLSALAANEWNGAPGAAEVDVQIPEINFCESLGLAHFLIISATGAAVGFLRSMTGSKE